MSKMHVLLVKMSSMGDVIHCLPALTDAMRAIRGIRFDWVVEEAFSEIPAWHPAVDKVYPIAFRKWRKSLLSRETWRQWRAFRRQVNAQPYDLILDAQGLVKSAFVSRWFGGAPRAGLDWSSARENLASVFYGQRHRVNFQQHAIVRSRQLFAGALGYPYQETTPDYGIDRRQLAGDSGRYLVFLHGTTWLTKHWPEDYWQQLAVLATKAGFTVKLPWGNAAEQQRAQRIAGNNPDCEVLPKMNLMAVAKVLAGAAGAVAVDTGLGHMAAALAVPTVSIYGPTNPDFTGALGLGQHHLRADFTCAPCFKRQCDYPGEHTVEPPCFATLPADKVWQTFVNNL